MQTRWIGSATRDRIFDFASLDTDTDLEFDPLVRSIAEQSPDLIMLLDRAGCVRFINRTVPDLSIDQVIGQQILRWVPPGQREMALDHYERVALTAQPTEFHSDYYAADGGCSHWCSHVYPFVRDDRVIGFVVFAREIARSEEPVKAQDDLLFDLCEDMLSVQGPDGRFERVNLAFERALGYGRGELLGRRMADFVHPDDSGRGRAAEVAVRPQRVFAFENRMRRRDGEYRVFAWRISEAGGRTFAVARDVTERTQLEAQQLDRQKLDSLGRMTTGVAHDFGNLLQAVRLAAGAARQRAGRDPLLGSALDDIERATERAGDLIQRLIAFARKEPPTIQPVDLNGLCRELLPLLRRLLPGTIEIALTLSNEPCVVAADRAQLEQVLLNLCLNARDAMPEGGQLRITTVPGVRADEAFCRERPHATPGASYALLRVGDNGAGMSEEVLARAFEPFFSTKPKGQGNGVGLATARDTVDRYGGLLQVHSRKGLGSVFDIYVPEAAAEHGVCGVADPTQLEAVNPSKGTILLAEDEELVRTPLRELLELAGYRVVCARDGQEAVDLYRRAAGSIDLLLLDIAMPRMSGPQVLAELRKENRAVRALFTSGYDRSSPQGEACDGGEMLHKPYDSTQLLRRIAETLASARG